MASGARIRTHEATDEQNSGQNSVLGGRVVVPCKAWWCVEPALSDIGSADFSADMDLAQTMDIFKLLTETYPRYVDAASREAVEAVGLEVVRRDESRDSAKLGVTEQVLGWLSNEVGRVSKRGSARCVGCPVRSSCIDGFFSSYAPADVFVLLSWSCGLYTVCLHAQPSFASTHQWKGLVGSMALLLNFLLGESRTKSSMQKSALVRTRRALRSAPEQLPALISTLLSSSAPLTSIPLLGVTVDVTIRLKTSSVQISPELKVFFFLSRHQDNYSSMTIQDEILMVYSNTILMSKVAVPSHVSVSSIFRCSAGRRCTLLTQR